MLKSVVGGWVNLGRPSLSTSRATLSQVTPDSGLDGLGGNATMGDAHIRNGAACSRATNMQLLEVKEEITKAKKELAKLEQKRDDWVKRLLETQRDREVIRSVCQTTQAHVQLLTDDLAALLKMRRKLMLPLNEAHDSDKLIKLSDKLRKLSDQLKKNRWERLLHDTTAPTSHSEFFKRVEKTARFWDLESLANAWSKPKEAKTTNEFPRFQVPSDPVHDNEDLVGKYWQRRINRWNTASTKAFTSSYLPFHQSMDRKKPDVLHYHPRQLENETNIIWIGSLKKRNRKNPPSPFSSQQKGQLVDHLRILILRQKRIFSIGYLTDGYRIQFFKLVLVEEKTRMVLFSSNLMFLRTSVKSSDIADGGKVLLQFLHNQNYADFGYCLPEDVHHNGHLLQFEGLVGHGHFANVYQVTLGSGDQCLLKVHKDRTALLQEKKNLETISQSSQEMQKYRTFMFTQLVGLTDDKKALLITPRGIPFAQTPAQIEDLMKHRNDKVMTMSRDLLLGLVDAVRFLHKKLKLVHRDIKLSNMFAVPVSVIMLLGIGLTRTLPCVAQQTCATLTSTCVTGCCGFTHLRDAQLLLVILGEASPNTLCCICVGRDVQVTLE